MSNLLNLKFVGLVLDALKENSESLKDLPPLECHMCRKCLHFGGIQTVIENNFSVDDVCGCGTEYVLEGNLEG